VALGHIRPPSQWADSIFLAQCSWVAKQSRSSEEGEEEEEEEKEKEIMKRRKLYIHGHTSASRDIPN
jgi:hypothetical protein